MTTQYAGPADARLGEGSPPETGTRSPPESGSDRFRRRYRALTAAELALHDQIKAKAAELEQLLEQIIAQRPETREGRSALAVPGEVQANRMLAVRHLEDCVYRAVKALTY